MQKKRAAVTKAFDVHVFLATACARDSVAAGCPKGERHSLLIFCRQPEGEAPDEQLARRGASTAGWREIRLERAKRLPVNAVPQDPVLRAAFQEALKDGVSVVAHRRSEDRPAAVADAALRR